MQKVQKEAAQVKVVVANVEGGGTRAAWNLLNTPLDYVIIIV